MWEEKDRIGWINLLALLRNNQAIGCMILATTRRKSVAKMIRTMADVKVNGLDSKNFWLFFRACAFGDASYEGSPSLQSIGKEIAKALKGCPLAARSVGALLKTDRRYQHWVTVRDKWKSLEVADDILPILKLSYDYLPVHLQRCFLYCSLFPEDYRFSCRKLVRAWISQNFVQCKGPTMRLEETGQKYFGRLVDLGFFQKEGSYHVMHDLMHELAGRVSSNECATIDGLKSEAIQPSVRHLSIITTAFDTDKCGSFPIEKFDKILQKSGPLQKLRTLMLFGRSSINLLGSLRILCKNAKYIRFLRIYVTYADISSIHSSLNPCHLRYLEFICVRTKNIAVYGVYNNTVFPQALTRFYHLQVLNAGISFSGNLALPSDMHNLVNLRCLISHEKVQHAIASVGNMTSLRELSFKVQNVGSFEIGQLQSMNELVYLEISQLQNVKTKEEASGARLLDKEYLEFLSLSWEDSSTNLEHDTAKDVLEGLQPRQNLKLLKISGYGGATSPTWLSSTLSITSLQVLHLEKCREWQVLTSLEMLPSLRKLTLIRMLNLMEISVPSLEELILIDLPKLEKCIGSYGMELTSHPRVLMIKNCPQLNEFSLFQSYSSFDAEQKSWFPSLRKLTIMRCPHIINWEILPLKEMGALKELELMDLHVVRELTVRSLEKLVLIKMASLGVCNSLKTSPPLHILPSRRDENKWRSSLCRLTIHDCPSMMVSHPRRPCALISELSVRGVPTLPTMRMNQRRFKIESNESSVLHGRVLPFHILRGITTLQIENCPNLVSLSSKAFSQLIALVRLRIHNCPNLTMSNIMSEVSLEKRKEKSCSFFLPSLKSLSIRTCGITGRWLTQMLAHLLSLEELKLTECPQIKFLSISQPTETEGTSSLASAVMISAQDEHELKLPYNLQCSLKKLWIQMSLDMEFCGGSRGLTGFTSLTELVLDRCPKLVSLLVGETKDDGIMEVGLLPPSLEELWIHTFPENLQSFSPEGIRSLKRLILIHAPRLKSALLHSCTGLEELRITGCAQLAVLDSLQFLTSLRSLDIKMNPELSSEWDLKLQEQEQGGNQIQLLPPSLDKLVIMALTDSFQSHLLPCLPSITVLKIHRSPELTSLQLRCCTTLKELEIEECVSLASVEGFQFIRNLTSLKVSGSPGVASWSELVSHQQGASEIWSGLETLWISDASVLCMPFCKQLTSLRHLQFGYWGRKQGESVVSLTEEQEKALQLLTSLQELKFLRCPELSSLPANLHRLTSLKTLSIMHCKSITRLPDMGLPTSLRCLKLYNCSEELGIQCRIAATEKLTVMIDHQDVN
ncbi:hypothetical protein CFC21_031758 [Triticum aestivum]|uniref:Uncharacterized protein n=5 Tax=Triticinae TaxID=1648030 RepID=A0A453CZU5_AEGTS|nr:hypothetical protein CFC21_031758 [Triticum aestivum]